ARHLARRGASAPADFEHVGLDVRGGVHGEILPPGEGRCSLSPPREVQLSPPHRGGVARSAGVVKFCLSAKRTSAIQLRLLRARRDSMSSPSKSALARRSRDGSTFSNTLTLTTA